MNITATRNQISAQLFALLTGISLLLSAFPTFVLEANAQESTGGGSASLTSSTQEDTTWLQLNKLISPDNFEGELSTSDFSFHIIGGNVDTTLSDGGVVELPVGTYEVTESYSGNDAIGFNPIDWTVYWAGDMCEGSANVRATEPGTLVVTESDIGKYTEGNPGRCNAENQFKPVVDETDTTRVTIEKKLSGPYPDVSDAADFTFAIETIGSPVTVSGTARDYASAVVELGVGEYSIDEIIPEGYVPENWSTQWSGPACENNGDATGTTIVIDETDIGLDSFSCRADNVYEGRTVELCDDPVALNFGEEGLCEYDENATSTVTVVKELIGTTTSPTQFSFRLNEGRSIGFETDGSNVIEVPEGEYTIEEVAATGYTITYSDDCSGSIGTGEQRTCTITNTWPDDNGGGGGQCEAEMPGWVDDHQNLDQGTQKGGSTVIPERSDADTVLGPADWSAGGSDGFLSLGFGGSIGIYFNKYVPDQDGDDISIHEATNGDYPLETAMVEVSQNGSDWETLSEEARNDANEDGATVTLLDFRETGFAWIKYVRLTDTTDPELHDSNADGYDLDAVDAVKKVCDEPDGNGDNGGGGNDEDTYRVEGYVWHDDNENTQWDGFQDQEATTTEEALSGWTVKITDGTETLSTTTDADGFYYFEVPEGTWTISETVMNGWDLITPNNNTHEVTVPATTTAQTFGERVFAFFVPTAHAAVLDTFGLFNFGNNESEIVTTGGGGGGSSSGGGGGGGSSRPRCTAFDITDSGAAYTLSWETRNGSGLLVTQDGTEIFSSDDDDVVDESEILVTTDTADFELTVSRGSREDTCVIEADDGNGGGGPDGEVLGEQVSVVPLGAANTGAGGSSPIQTNSFLQTLIFFLRDRFSFIRNAK